MFCRFPTVAASSFRASSKASRRLLSSKSQSGSITAATAASKSTSSVATKDGKGTVVFPQAPNRQQPWSESQLPRQVAMSGPRFEQVDLQAQPQPLSAMELISQQPIIRVKERLACCDGGGGALGHPKVYINLDRGVVEDCGYCGLRFQLDDAHHH